MIAAGIVLVATGLVALVAIAAVIGWPAVAIAGLITVIAAVTVTAGEHQ